MSTEHNKAVVRQMVEEVFGRGDATRVDAFLAPGFLEHEVMPPGIPGGREGVKALTAMLHRGFPDLVVTIEDIVAEGEKVALRMTWTGTHQGEFMGIPATGRHMSIGVIDVLRMADGRCAEHWGQMDTMGLMQQLGAMPVP